MNGKYEKLLVSTTESKGDYYPLFFRLLNPEDKINFNTLLESEAVFLHDEIFEQLKELIKILNPKSRLSADDYSEMITKHLDGVNIIEYGVWVYYPWSRRLVHILDKDEFIEVRTSRNQYKITIEEREILANKKIGIIGLSVGQSVALTMAMERSFGELRLADFDVLELTNLNRIRTGLYNLGIKKVVSVAREIAEIDPFLKVTIFPEGLTEENMDVFFTGEGKLDVLIDECDGVDIKILCRHKAKELRIPVLMEASDRTTIDVERFDLEPDRSILHGFIDHLDVSALKYLKTNEDRIPYLAPMVGIDTMSVRLKASAIEVGQSITTWPQLASAVALGGGAVADIWRRIALDQYHASGRYFIDMEEIAGDKKPEIEYKTGDHILAKPITINEAKNIAGNLSITANGHFAPAAEVIASIVTSAATAPSGGNSQPWKWIYTNGVLTLLHDKHYSFSFMDFQDRSSYIALGAAIENLVLKTHQSGLEITIHYFPDVTDKKVIAFFIFYPKGTNMQGIEPHVADELEGQIECRHTNRKVTAKTPIPRNIINELKTIGESVDGAKVQFFDNQQQLEDLGDIISATDKYRLTYPISHNDFTYQEMRWTSQEAELRKTGMDVTALELLPSELVGLRLIKDPKVVAFLRHINGGDIFRNVSRKAMSSASAAGFLSMPTFSEIDFINGGRASQRIWLKATEQNIAFQVMNVPLPFFARLEYDISDLPVEIVDDLKEQYARFYNVISDSENKGEIYLFRIFVAEKPNVTPLRRQLEDILIIG
jgi:molybdopterin/thiamine biosynthesis adenylyltransferase